MHYNTKQGEGLAQTNERRSRMTMHTDNYPTGEFRTMSRTVVEVDERMAEALGRPAMAHVVVEEQELVYSHWESNATSGETQSWVARSQRRETLDGSPL